jgi:hypothetical protein
MITFRQIAGIMGEVEPGFSFTIFPVRICQLADEVSFISGVWPPPARSPTSVFQPSYSPSSW